MKIFLKVIGVLLIFLVAGAAGVEANIAFGSGYYTNLCDSGTAANYYNCDPRCNTTTGSCSSSSDGVVKWTCNGKWDQCLESETGWSNSEQVGGANCGTTVQLSLFDKKCRRDDGSWDGTCKLLGYMVWYSGDCTASYVKTPVSTIGINMTTQTPPTTIPQNTTTPGPTTQPTVVPTIASKFGTTYAPTPTPTKATELSLCGKSCQSDSDCQAGFVCNTSGVCRNPACIEDASCFCGQVAAAVATKAPDTGESSWWGIVMLAGLGFLGMRMRKLAKKVW